MCAPHTHMCAHAHVEGPGKAGAGVSYMCMHAHTRVHMPVRRAWGRLGWGSLIHVCAHTHTCAHAQEEGPGRGQCAGSHGHRRAHAEWRIQGAGLRVRSGGQQLAGARRVDGCVDRRLAGAQRGTAVWTGG